MVVDAIAVDMTDFAGEPLPKPNPQELEGIEKTRQEAVLRYTLLGFTVSPKPVLFGDLLHAMGLPLRKGIDNKQLAETLRKHSTETHSRTYNPLEVVKTWTDAKFGSDGKLDPNAPYVEPRFSPSDTKSAIEIIGNSQTELGPYIQEDAVARIPEAVARTVSASASLPDPSPQG